MKHKPKIHCFTEEDNIVNILLDTFTYSRVLLVVLEVASRCRMIPRHEEAKSPASALETCRGSMDADINTKLRATWLEDEQGCLRHALALPESVFIVTVQHCVVS